LAAERLMGSKQRGYVWPQYTGWAITMFMVMLGWVMFRAPTVGDAFTMYAGMFGLTGFGISAETIYFNQPLEFAALMLGGALAVFGEQLKRLTVQPLVPVMPIVLLGLCVIVLQARTHSPFLYFQF
jgi:alginate O-acetyltransferase complex protein AlgI